MAAIKSWEVSDEFWSVVEPFIPKVKRPKGRKYLRKFGGGRKAMGSRRVFEAIVYVLRTGIQWKALPKSYGSASSIHKYFQLWHRAGVFNALWKEGLSQYDEMEGIAWQWQSIDGAMNKAPLATEAVGSNPTDRGKKWTKKELARGRTWNPAVDRRERS